MSRQPNIVFILMDDLGWRDLSCYGSTFYETPNLDRLARQGIRFTDAYAACPVCSPTRASIMSGKYPARVGVTNYIAYGTHHPARGKLVDAPYVKELSLSETSVATALREGGYQTWHVGKWHLGKEPTWPDRHGFDVNIGGCDKGHPHDGYFAPYKIPSLAEGPDGEYLTERLTDEAVRLIRNRQAGKPFFLNFWHYAPHTPLQAPEHLVQKYRDKARRLRLDQINPIVSGEPHPAEHRSGQFVQRRIIQSNPHYAAMIETIDDSVGRIMQVLDEIGEADNTLLIFTSDNGGLATTEGSPTCNSPLAEGKGWMYEGGTRDPLIVRWPGRITPDSTCVEPITSPDFYPTLLEAAGLSPRPAQHVDGVSIMPLLEGKPQTRGPIFWHYPHYGNQGCTPGSSVREGDWKLIEFFEDGRLELYNLREDVSEAHNLAAARPQITRRMHASLKAWRESVEALMPTTNADWKPVSSEKSPSTA
jgi:arylsulfatase A-like enzyme